MNSVFNSYMQYEKYNQKTKLLVLVCLVSFLYNITPPLTQQFIFMKKFLISMVILDRQSCYIESILQTAGMKNPSGIIVR
jgi:hypothetical protein